MRGENAGEERENFSKFSLSSPARRPHLSFQNFLIFKGRAQEGEEKKRKGGKAKKGGRWEGRAWRCVIFGSRREDAFSFIRAPGVRCIPFTQDMLYGLHDLYDGHYV